MRSKLAVWSFILSLAPIVLFLLVILVNRIPILGLSVGITDWFRILVLISLISLVLSIISLYRIKKYELEGKGLVIVGLVISLMSIIFEILVWSNLYKFFPD